MHRLIPRNCAEAKGDSPASARLKIGIAGDRAAGTFNIDGDKNDVYVSAMPETEALKYVRVVSYDPDWPRRYAEERACLVGLGDARLMELEHIGSTAVPGLCAKPIIDMMAAVIELNEGLAFALRLNFLGYELIETGMNARLFLRRRSEADGQVFHLHIVERRTWDLRKERLMRDYLLAHPDAASAYSDLKRRLAEALADDSLAYTKAKTAFIQDLIDKARAKIGLSSVDVWTD